jgi:cell division protein FtsL
MEELYSIIGKLYADIYQAQKYIDLLQNQIKEKDKQLSELRKTAKNNLNE